MTEPHDVRRGPEMGGDLRLTLDHEFRAGARIKVVGVGGWGWQRRRPYGGLRIRCYRVHCGQH